MCPKLASSTVLQEIQDMLSRDENVAKFYRNVFENIVVQTLG